MFDILEHLLWQIFFGILIILIVILSILNTFNVSFDYIFGNNKLPLIVLMSISFVLG
ncbi:LapA family protein, partial [Francisella tularensis]|uniref:LapA family protein n=1 Tax=Francisella tularensis TaxID=263 RepID=UPI002381A312